MIFVRDGQAREAQVELFFLVIRLADKDLDSNGPGNAPCDPRGTAEVNDTIPFDGAFGISVVIVFFVFLFLEGGY
jgi:hypothetical protein